MPLVIEGCDAAGACTGGAYTKTIQVDNTTRRCRCNLLAMFL